MASTSTGTGMRCGLFRFAILWLPHRNKPGEMAGSAQLGTAPAVTGFATHEVPLRAMSKMPDPAEVAEDAGASAALAHDIEPVCEATTMVASAGRSERAVVVAGISWVAVCHPRRIRGSVSWRATRQDIPRKPFAPPTAAHRWTW